MEVTFHAWKVNIAIEGCINALEQTQLPSFRVNFLPVPERALIYIFLLNVLKRIDVVMTKILSIELCWPSFSFLIPSLFPPLWYFVSIHGIVHKGLIECILNFKN